ncbi:MAG: hypothetical protein ABH832_01705 [bacterium]
MAVQKKHALNARVFFFSGSQKSHVQIFNNQSFYEKMAGEDYGFVG